MVILSIVVSVIAIVISIVFFFYANKSANIADKTIVRIQTIVEDLNQNSVRLLDTALNALVNKSKQETNLLKGLLTRNEKISNKITDHIFRAIKKNNSSIQYNEEFNVSREELVKITKKELNKSVNKELESVLENQRDNILTAMIDFEEKLKDNSLQTTKKEQLKEKIWQLRQELDNVKSRLKEISNHT